MVWNAIAQGSGFQERWESGRGSTRLCMTKTIWTCWFQGRENAPRVIKSCLASWERNNPNWDFRCLDASSIERYVPIRQYLDLNKQTLTAASVSVCSDRGIAEWVHTARSNLHPGSENPSSGYSAPSSPSSSLLRAGHFPVPETSRSILSLSCTVASILDLTPIVLENRFPAR